MNYIEQGIKVGDKVWTVQEGSTTVTAVSPLLSYPISTSRYKGYTADGRQYEGDKHPSLFWSKPYDTPPEKPEPPKYQWLWKHKTGRAWSLSCGYHADEDELRKYLVLDNRFDVRKFDLQED